MSYIMSLYKDHRDMCDMIAQSEDSCATVRSLHEEGRFTLKTLSSDCHYFGYLREVSLSCLQYICETVGVGKYMSFMRKNDFIRHTFQNVDLLRYLCDNYEFTRKDIDTKYDNYYRFAVVRGYTESAKYLREKFGFTVTKFDSEALRELQVNRESAYMHNFPKSGSVTRRPAHTVPSEESMRGATVLDLKKKNTNWYTLDIVSFDVVTGLILKLTLPALPEGMAYKDNLKQHAFERIVLEFGGQLIDKLTPVTWKLLDMVTLQPTTTMTPTTARQSKLYLRLPFNVFPAPAFAFNSYSPMMIGLETAPLCNWIKGDLSQVIESPKMQIVVEHKEISLLSKESFDHSTMAYDIFHQTQEVDQMIKPGELVHKIRWNFQHLCDCIAIFTDAPIERISIETNGVPIVDDDAEYFSEYLPQTLLHRPIPDGQYFYSFCDEPLRDAGLTGGISASMDNITVKLTLKREVECDTRCDIAVRSFQSMGYISQMAGTLWSK